MSEQWAQINIALYVVLGIDICTHPAVSTILYVIVLFNIEHFSTVVLKESYVRVEDPRWYPVLAMSMSVSVGHQSIVFVCSGREEGKGARNVSMLYINTPCAPSALPPSHLICIAATSPFLCQVSRKLKQK